MKRVGLFFIVFLFIFAAIHFPRACYAHSPAITAGINFLVASQNPDGSWVTDTSKADQGTVTAVVLQALSILGEGDTAAYQTGSDWLASQSLSTTDSLSRRILAGVSFASDPDQLISALDSQRKAWGGANSYDVNLLDSALALQALRYVNGSDSAVGYALNYLLSNQHSDGGWGFSDGSDSSVYHAALVGETLRQYSQTYRLDAEIAKCVDYILAYRHADGGFGQEGSSVVETAAAYLVLAGSTTDNTILGGISEYLISMQGTSGDWNADQFATSLALMVLANYDSYHVPASQSDYGVVTGRIVDAVSNQPLDGTVISLSSDQLVSTTSDYLGNFRLSNVPAGEITVEVNLAAYGTGSVDVLVAAGQVKDVGTLALSLLTTSGSIKGTVTDSLNGLALSGVLISYSGIQSGTTTTDASGQYSINGLAAGEITITLALAGYETLTVTGQSKVGTVLTFSPSLKPLVAQGPGRISGKLVDAVTGLPVAGAILTLSSNATIKSVSAVDGSFSLSPIPVGNQQVVITHLSYNTLTLHLLVQAGDNIFGDIALSAQAVSGMVSGTVRDTNGMTLSDVTVSAIVGGNKYQVISDAAGSFALEDLAAGDVAVQVEKTGYQPVSADLTVTPASISFFNPVLTSAFGSIAGTVLDASAQSPVEGAVITLVGRAPVYTLRDGIFHLENVPAGAVDVAISAEGYEGQSFRIWVSGGTHTEIQSVYLRKIENASTITGTVVDANSAEPVAGARVMIIESGAAVTTGPDGRFAFVGIDLLDFTVAASAPGYDSMNFTFSSNAYGVVNADLTLSATLGTSLEIASLSTDAMSYEAERQVSIQVVIDNPGTFDSQALLQAVISDESGEVLDKVAPMEPLVDLAPSESVSREIVWNTGRFAPGNYLVAVRLIALGSLSTTNHSGVMLAEKAAFLSITPSPALSGAIALDPPVTQVDLQRPIKISAAVRNTGNTALQTSLVLTATLDGAVSYETEVPAVDLAVNQVGYLELGSFVPLNAGTYVVTLAPKDTQVVANIGTELFVGTHATGIFTVEPSTVYPGTAQIKGTIHLEGVGLAEGVVQNPQIPIIKEAIQKGVDWEQQAVMSWQNTNKCNGCHIQSQTLVGLAAAKNIVNVDNDVVQLLLNSFVSWQYADGSSQYSFSQPVYPLTTTNLSLWGMAAVNDAEYLASYVTKAADYMLTRQEANGKWVRDLTIPYMWWYEDVSFTAVAMIGVAKAYSYSGDTRYYTSLDKATRWLAQDGLVPSGWDMVRSHQLLGLNAARQFIIDQALLQQMSATADKAINLLKADQRSDGGWGRYNTYASDSLVTAQVLYAMLHAGVPATDDSCKKAIDFLLNTQKANGAWYSQNRIMSTDLAATSWVMIALPLAFEKARGIDARVDLSLAPTSAISSVAPQPVYHPGNQFSWDLNGIEETGKDITFNLEISDLRLGETRPVAQGAAISFRDAETNEEVTLAIDVPSVTVSSPVNLEISTDKPVYRAEENALFTVNLHNVSNNYRQVDLDLAVKDQQGYNAFAFDTTNIVELDPALASGWHYRLPLTVHGGLATSDSLFKITVDFTGVFNSLGISDKVLDRNSIRIVEKDPTTNNAFERPCALRFSENNRVEITSSMGGEVVTSGDRSFYLYFDVMENGLKPAANYGDFLATGMLVAYSNWDGRVYVAKLPADGSFGTPRDLGDLSGGADGAWGVVLDDFNNDGFVDIVTASATTSTVYYMQNTADGTDSFAPKVAIGSIGSSNIVFEAESGDFNGDGNQDFVINDNTSSRALYMFLGKGDGTFTRSTAAISPGSIYRAKVAIDFDQDGKLDLFVSEYNGGIYYYRGKGNGTFETPKLICDIGLNPNGLAYGDFDSDGIRDLIVNDGCNPQGSCNTYILAGMADGIFATPKNITTLDTDDFTAYGMGDFNQDGHLDLVAATHNGRRVFVFHGNGQGSFVNKGVLGITSNATLGISVAPAMVGFKTATVGSPEPVTQATYGFTWNTGKTAAGQYVVAAKTLENQGIEARVEAPLSIEVTSGGAGAALSSRVASDKIAYLPGESVKISTLATNLSTNFNYQNLDTLIEVTDASGVNLLRETGWIDYLAAGQFDESVTNWSGGQAPKGIYNVTYTLTENGNVLSIATTSFEIFGSATTGARITGTLATSAPNSSWGAQEFFYSVVNNGNEDLQDIEVNILIIDPASDTLVHSATVPSDLAKGGILEGTLAVDTGSLASGLYMAVLTVSSPIMAAPKTLDSVNFEVMPSLQVTTSLPDLVNLLVWVNDSCVEDGDGAVTPDADWPPGKECAREDILATILGQAVDSYTLVHDRQEFENELRNPIHTDILILGNQAPLTDHVASELGEMVYSGTGLITSNWYENGLIEEIFGLKVVGSLAKGCKVPRRIDTAIGPVTAGTSLEVSGSMLRVEVDNTRQMAGWLADDPCATEESAYPAIVSGELGNGRAVFFSFDLGAELSPENAGQYGDLLTAAISHIHNPLQEAGLHPYQLVPHITTLHSLGGTFDISLRQSYSPELGLLDPYSSLWVDDNPWRRQTTLDSDQYKDILCYILLPEQRGNFFIDTEVGMAISGQYRSFDSLHNELSVPQSAGGLNNELITAIMALTTGKNDKGRVKHIVALLQGLELENGIDRYGIEENIRNIQQAIGSLLELDSLAIDPIRLKLAELLRIEQHRWYLTPPPPMN